MTITAPPETRVQQPVPQTGGVRRWWRSWRVALRLARRDAWRDKWRSLLVVVIILAPVAVLTTLDVYYRTDAYAKSSQWRGLVQLGTNADAIVVGVYPTPVAQSPNGSWGGSLSRDGTLRDGGPGPLDARTAEARFPSSWQSARTWSEAVFVGDNRTQYGVDLTVADTRDPLVSDRYVVVEGWLPSTQGEVAVDVNLADTLGLTVGAVLNVRSQDESPARSWHRGPRVVGIVNGPDDLSVVALPGTVPEPRRVDSSWLVRTPAPLSWSDVRALNKAGLMVRSRQVLTDPPAFCTADQICADDRALSKPLEDGGGINLAMRPEEAAASAAVATLALLQVALMAGPAFAVSLRRRQRDLALVGANGGTPVDLRRTILSSALVLGLVAAGAAIGAAWLLMRVATALAPRFGKSMWPNPVLAPEIVVLALVAVVAALAAAWLPARMAGRTDVLHALRGRRPAGPLRRWVAGLGAGLVVAGTGLIAIGAVAAEAVSITLGLLVFQVGTILLVPWLVTAVAHGGRRLPVSLRLATRDSARSRMRTVSAVSAVAAAAIGATATLVGTASNVAGRSHFYAPRAQPGVVLADITYSGDAPGRTDPTAAISALRAALTESLPGATVGVAERLGGVGGNADTTVVLHLPDCPHPVTEDGQAISGSADDCAYAAPNSNLSGVVRADDQWYAAVTGDTRAAVRQALASGSAVVLDPQAMQGDKVSLATVTRGDDGAVTRTRTATLPARLAAFGLIGPRVIVGPSAALPKAWATTGVVSVAVTPPTGVDGARAQAAVEAAAGSLRAATGGQWGRGDHAYLEQGYEDDLRVILALVVAGTLGLALVAALSVTALALADARPDLATMAAVGAPPRARRSYAAASALVVAGLGCAVGVVAGLVPGWGLARLWGVGWQRGATVGDGHQIPASDFLTVPWPALLAIAVGIPLVTAALAWLFTRSRVPLTRRAD